MSSRLPEYIDPWHFAEIGKEISGRVGITGFSRLTEVLVDHEGEAEFELRFQKGQKRRVHIKGYVRAELGLECQRCLEPVRVPVATEMDVVVVEGYDEAGLLGDEFEPLLAGDKRIRLNEVIEDELLLALPQVPMHRQGECKASLDQTGGSPEQVDEEQEQSKPNPFAVLADLKSKQN
jgi:uncharacterized protein